MKGQPLQTLRSNKDYFTLEVPPISNLSRTCRSFSYCGPTVWNSLPYDIRTLTDPSIFKSKLKTHLFMKAFQDTD